MAAIKIRPIGVVRTKAAPEEVKGRKIRSELVISEGLEEALEGVEGFSHLFVIFWMDRLPATGRGVMKVHPRGRVDIPLQGIFATRAPNRPNPIGLTVVRLLGREGNILRVEGLDAFDGTPILDIKPYDPWDLHQDIKVPEWWRKLRERKEP